MPATFDPNLPASHSPMSSTEMRNQFNALRDLIAGLQTQVTALQQAVNTRATKPTVAQFTEPLDDPPTTANLNWIVSLLNQLIADLEA
jgi:hypothetical protein